MDKKYINAMRILSLQAIQVAKQGHVGMSMSAAPITYTLYTQHINISDKCPKWINRDRFVLSAGHGSMSIYSVLHFAGLLSLKDIKDFKTEDSKTPGHPEYEPKNYIDASTGPLGQGVAMAVGMAIAEKYLNNKFKELPGLINHHTYVVVGDGDLQEGISYEAMSLAGKLNLNKLICLHDSNNYQLDSSVDQVFNEDLQKRMESMHWNYIKVNTTNPVEIDKAIAKAKKSERPTFIEVKTIIGEGVSCQNSNKAHSMALKDQDLADANKYYKTAYDKFSFPREIYNHFSTSVVKRGAQAYDKWLKLCHGYAQKKPQLYKQFQNWTKGDFGNVENILKTTPFSATNVATRNYVKDVLNQLTKYECDWLLSGCADLIAATNIRLGTSNFNSDVNSNNILFGIREFAMGAITNGILLYGGLRTVSGTFLVFSDYLKSAIRLGALMDLPNLYIFTHDSYQVGGDGPTHQPVDQLAMLRAIPNVSVHRPADEKEFLGAMTCGLTSRTQTNIIVLTRHNLSSEHGTTIANAKTGAYIIYEDKNPDLTLVAGGSELDLVFALKDLMHDQKLRVKIISTPNLQALLNMSEDKITTLLASKAGVLSVEPSSDALWYKLHAYTKAYHHVGAHCFGKSMDGAELYDKYGFNAKSLFAVAKKYLLK